jgi:hypothetical protein
VVLVFIALQQGYTVTYEVILYCLPLLVQLVLPVLLVQLVELVLLGQQDRSGQLVR